MSLIYFVSWLCDRIRISTYIQVFRENEDSTGWETRSKKLRFEKKLPHVQTLIAYFFVVFGLVSAVILYLSLEPDSSIWLLVLLGVTIAIFITVIIISGVFTYPLKEFIKKWKKIKQKEK